MKTLQVSLTSSDPLILRISLNGENLAIEKFAEWGDASVYERRDVYSGSTNTEVNSIIKFTMTRIQFILS